MDERTRCLIFDPFAGISGDMILGALIDVGLEAEWLTELVDALDLQVSVTVDSVIRGALSACAVDVKPSGPPTSRHLDDVLAIIQAAQIDETAKANATSAFRRLADVEGAVHGLPAHEVHFHEVGGDDAIVDILGACAGVTRLGIDRCYTRPVSVGHGWVSSQHGSLPVPAPATLRLLEGTPVHESGLEGELTTPTGAVLLWVLTAGRPAPYSYVPIRSGFGAGSRDPDTHPNCLRVVVAEHPQEGILFLLQADIDDMSPEYVPPLLESLRAAGAIDVWTHPVSMKKGRTGLRVEALVPETGREAVSRALFEGSTTLGARFWTVEREVLPRTTETIEWRGFKIRVKMATSPDGHVRCKLEYDDVVEAAEASGVPILEARQEIGRLLDRDL
jgi:uncharacterized protein (TIGR00299 family) protein